ncbi:right-handed parallel beta-helix repeat-containing protein [Carboxylicivirga marina]|uniref:Right-handed parallel beta-helix repeat-containing protein n=1 Tax=Carboxylicivirga marina TaxID=2800988 RepID=A0ABS1HQ43_9BACT|nr:right-handed parallel beta-helix repeat-containing protein [Carboxylicivirga marina]MBK3519667.1 right-handed parallel beta-helix repeat-containing protein [Carboxylicivirga marina]
MKRVIYFFFSLLMIACNNTGISTSCIGVVYPNADERTASKEEVSYYIDPVKGNDANSGTQKDAPWKTFRRVNQLRLSKGNKIEILAPGAFRESLFFIGQGTAEQPIEINFAKGQYDFYPEKAYRSKFHISNTNDAPDSLKAVAFYFLDAENVKVNGNDAEIIFRGKTIETSLNNCKHVSIEGIGFNYKRPTVSEIEVITVNERYADVQIHKDSKYQIADSMLVWIGEGWKHQVKPLWQEFNPEASKVSRKWLSLKNIRFSALQANQIRIHYDKNPGLKKGLIYQNRNTFRDYAGIFIQKSKDITLKNVNIHFMHGMGVVSQYCENVTMDGVSVRPKENSGRTCAAWADILHFSGCKGNLEIMNCYLSAANDDAINIHGTHLRIVDVVSSRRIKVRFMHKQSYGFEAFFAGDSIEFISAKTLLPYAQNKVVSANTLNEKEIELTLHRDIPNDIQPKDVIENITCTANVLIRNNKIIHIPTRGILVTTRGKVVIENNELFKTQMSGILIADDANSWYESGYVKDVTIRTNKFIECEQPVINIHPENSEMVDEYPVHSNIRISDNQFILKNAVVLAAKSTGNIDFVNNKIVSAGELKVQDIIRLKGCSNMKMEGNELNNKVVEF